MGLVNTTFWVDFSGMESMVWNGLCYGAQRPNWHQDWISYLASCGSRNTTQRHSPQKKQYCYDGDTTQQSSFNNNTTTIENTAVLYTTQTINGAVVEVWCV